VSALLPIVVMGVSGCGKSTVGVELARHLDAHFIDADDLHSAEAVAKMSHGLPLTDEDRGPWLDRVSAAIMSDLDDDSRPVVACSALRRGYRDRLRAGVGRPIYFVHLVGDEALLRGRLDMRSSHFMPADLLRSQFVTLEALSEGELGHAVDVATDVPTILDDTLSRFSEHQEACA
jgi:gluconokinase